jgi:hypothetical protein
MLIPFGVLSAAGGGEPVALSDYELIATAFGTGSSGVITFSSIPQTYKQLQIRYTAKNTSTSRQINLTMNGVTSSVYASHLIGANTPPGVGSAFPFSSNTISQTEIRLTDSMAADSGAGVVTGGIIDILDYSSTSKNTTIRVLSGSIPTTNDRIRFASGLYNETTAVTSLTLTAAANNFASLSRFSLYGIKG